MQKVYSCSSPLRETKDAFDRHIHLTAGRDVRPYGNSHACKRGTLVALDDRDRASVVAECNGQVSGVSDGCMPGIEERRNDTHRLAAQLSQKIPWGHKLVPLPPDRAGGEGQPDQQQCHLRQGTPSL